MIDVYSLIPRLVRASLSGETQRVESLALTAARTLRKTHPGVAEEIAESLAHHHAGASPIRAVGIEPPPVDSDTRLSLVGVEEPIPLPAPVLPEADGRLLHRFLHEWRLGERLLAKGLKPPTSVLLVGAPGVGKTYSVRYLASELGLPLLVLDLSTAVSSYLGKTGHNLRTVLDYARSQPSVLFLDEFDAVAKRRDDPSDLGELKRIVNVLLKELETWPSHGVLAAATNHPELLDKAIWRRFDHVVTIGMPGRKEREKLLQRHLSEVLPESPNAIGMVADLTEGISSADVCKFSDRVMRQVILDGAQPMHAVFQELPAFLDVSRSKLNGAFCRAAKSALGDQVSIREIASWLGITHSTVHHHLAGLKEGDQVAEDR